MTAGSDRTAPAAGRRGDAEIAGTRALSLRNHLMPAAVLVLLIAFFYGPYLSSDLPGEDFPGGLAYFSLFREALAKGYPAPVWVPEHQSGHPFVLLRPGMGEFYLAAPFALFFPDDLAALKCSQVTFSVLSGLLFYLFLWKLLKSRAAAFVGGAFYAVHPVALSFGYLSGHLEFPFFYAALPVCLLSFHALSQHMTYRRVLATVAALTCLFFIDVERTATALPFLALFFAVLAFAGEGTRRGEDLASVILGRVLKPLLVVALFFALVTAWGIIPVVLESGHHELFEEDVVVRSISTFSFNNVFLLLDRMGALVRPMQGHAPGVFTFNDGRFYVGLAGLAAWLPVLAFRRRLRLHPAFYGALAALTGSLWLSFGPHSIYGRTGELVESLLSDPGYARGVHGWGLIGILFAAALCVLASALWLWLRRSPGRADVRRLLLIAAALALVLFTAPYPFLRRYGLLYEHMRGPCYFWASTAPWASALAAAGAVAALARSLRTWIFAGIVAALVAFGVWDLAPYREYLDRAVPGEKVLALDDVGRWLREEGKDGRILSRESYNPLIDLLASRSGRPHAWGWLNWIAPRDTSRFYMGSVYPALSGLGTFREGLALAGLANVRYVVFTLDEGPSPPDLPELTSVIRNDSFAVYENSLWRPFIQVYPVGAVEDGRAHPELTSEGDEVDLTWRRADAETISVRIVCPESRVVMAAESYHPNWRVTVDGRPGEVLRVQGASLGARVPGGEHTVVFRYRRPWYFAASALLSGIGALVILALRRRRWRRQLLRASADRLERLGV